MWAFGFGELPVGNGEEMYSLHVPLRAEAGQGVENGFWLLSNVHRLIQMSAIPNLFKATID